MTLAEIARLRALLRTASPGPWFPDFAHWGKAGVHRCLNAAEQKPPSLASYLNDNEVEYIYSNPPGSSLEDAEFIAAMRNAAPALLDAVEERDALLRTEELHQGALVDLIERTDQLARATEEAARLRAALSFYADPENWSEDGAACSMVCEESDDDGVERDTERLEMDNGKRAREALASEGATVLDAAIAFAKARIVAEARKEAKMYRDAGFLADESTLLCFATRIEKEPT